MKRWQKTLVIAAVEVVGLLVLHALLLWYMAEHDVVSKIFAAGGHLPRTTLLAAALFLGIRLFTVLGLPGVILCRLCVAAVEWVRDARLYGRSS